TACAAEHHVGSADDIERVMKHAAPGDTLIMNDGDWHDQEIAFSGNGTEQAPITLRAATPGKVRLLGNSRLLMHGDHLVASGLFFGDASSSESIVDIKGNENRFTDSMIIAPHREA